MACSTRPITCTARICFVDFYQAPERVRRLLDLIGELIVDVALAVRARTGTCSMSVNRMVAHVDPAIFLHANCSVQMISPESYRADPAARSSSAWPRASSRSGSTTAATICTASRRPTPSSGRCFYDVGWGSDVAACRAALPDAFLNLRLSPIRMLRATPAEIAEDTERLLQAAGPLERGRRVLHQHGLRHAG